MKLQKWFIFLALSIAALWAAGTLAQAQKTPAEPVNWLEGDRLKGDLSPSEQEAALNRVQKHPYWKFIPKEIQQAIISNKENYSKVGVGSLIHSHRVRAYVNGFKRKQMTITVFPTMWQHIDIINAPVQTPAVNPKTGKPYVSVPQKMLAGLSPEDRSYIEQLTDRLNQNIHYLGNTPLPRLDLKRFKRGGYALSAVLPLALHDSKFITDKYFMENNKVTKEEQLKNFGIEDPVAFDLGQRFLMPIPDPRLMYPLGYTGVGMECTREPRGGREKYGVGDCCQPDLFGMELLY